MSIDRVIGFDPAEPGSDRTVIAIHGGDADEMDAVARGLLERGIDVVFIGARGSEWQCVGHDSQADVAKPMPPADLIERQFASMNAGSQDRLRDRWGRLKR